MGRYWEGVGKKPIGCMNWHVLQVLNDVVSQFGLVLLARILIHWVGSFNGRIEDIGLTRMVMNGNR
ncbi:MAG TPA: hypothetical protein DD706_10675 [Nitrospiraceae bacterium]|nr:hypothetical protein [Nitrospiraceae bacterium]